ILQKGLEEGQKTYSQCPDSSLKRGKTLFDVTEALYFDANIELTIQYLEWINNITSLEKHLRDLFFIGSESFWVGREDFQKAGQFYKWIIEKYPDSEYGYMGMIVVSFHTNLESPGPYCEHLLKIDPNFESRKEKSFWEGQVVRFINAYLEHKK
ncbi:MAG: hypothetical protein H7246_02030, partial [Phycisphaerae bacterium]|nr:hypothetical protein [Saprospiraceae bacterium]